MAELCKLLVDGKRLPELPPEMAELLRKHMVEQEEHIRQKEAAEAQETRCQEADEKAEQRRRVEAEKQQLKRKRKEDEANRATTRGVLEVPVYGYEENREVKITAGPNGENLLEYVVKAKALDSTHSIHSTHSKVPIYPELWIAMDCYGLLWISQEC
ncbi:hypothetical protein BT96DRAFT_934424 [Gymnopus androsaceus JB14]|uniref:Uncharacterized protein n=1 Tax=Gymnopus androsaceus JB14 TaxID=1447944 RepID=A0A6A4I892_9AGAR|nr:hypothetical protein BT96DRAFT_934424 [Gymnopus androsaceus JB14]